MGNPFETINNRLNSIESLLSDLATRLPGQIEAPQKDIGGVEVAIQETGLTSHSIYRLVSERKIPHIKKGGRLYFSRKAIQKWLLEGERSKAA
jgi:hypothetical protein